MTDFTEQAREWLEEHVKETFPLWTEAIELLTAALTAAYEQGLEDAAQIVDHDPYFASTHDELVVKIRALKEKE